MKINFNEKLLKKIEENDSSLTSLDLSNQNLTKKDILDLATALKNNTYISTLNLSSNRLGIGSNTLTGDELAKLVAENIHIPNLNLDSNDITPKGVEYLNKNKNIKRLDLNNNNIGDEGAIVLSKNKNILQLNLALNKIGNSGAEALSSNEILNELVLSLNKIDDEGVLFFEKTKIKKLDFEGNHIKYSDTKNKLLENENIIELLFSENKFPVIRGSEYSFNLLTPPKEKNENNPLTVNSVVYSHKKN